MEIPSWLPKKEDPLMTPKAFHDVTLCVITRRAEEQEEDHASRGALCPGIHEWFCVGAEHRSEHARL